MTGVKGCKKKANIYCCVCFSRYVGKVTWYHSKHRSGPIPAGRALHSAVLWGHRMVVFGGNLITSIGVESTGELWIYDIVKGFWEQRFAEPGAPLPAPRSSHSAVVVS
jgi:hypothetical protein